MILFRNSGLGVQRCLLFILASSFLIFHSACEPTFRRATLEKNIRELARRDYGFEVDVAEAGETVGVRYVVKDLLGAMASGERDVGEDADHLLLVLRRVTLSMDRPPAFFVLKVVDEAHPDTGFVFTRYVDDVRKVMANALSRNAYFDGLLTEFSNSGKLVSFDRDQMDFVSLLMLSADVDEKTSADLSDPWLTEVAFADFLPKVAAQSLRRELRERKEVKNNFVVREVVANYGREWGSKGEFRVTMDLAATSGAEEAYTVIQKKILPYALTELKKVLKLYKFQHFSAITLIEKNSGAMSRYQV